MLQADIPAPQQSQSRFQALLRRRVCHLHHSSQISMSNTALIKLRMPQDNLRSIMPTYRKSMKGSACRGMALICNLYHSCCRHQLTCSRLYKEPIRVDMVNQLCNLLNSRQAQRAWPESSRFRLFFRQIPVVVQEIAPELESQFDLQE